MTLFQANLSIVARIHGGAAKQQITLDPQYGGDPINHLGVPLSQYRKLFCELDRPITFNKVGVPAGYVPSAFDCYVPAQTELQKTLPRQFDLDGNNAFPQVHAWIDGHWVRLMGANQYGYGYLITKYDAGVDLYKTLNEPVKWGAGPVDLVLDFLLTISGTAY